MGGSITDSINLVKKIEDDGHNHPESLPTDANLLNGASAETWNSVKTQMDDYNKNAAAGGLPNITIAHEGQLGDGHGTTSFTVHQNDPEYKSGYSPWKVFAKGQIGTVGGILGGGIVGAFVGAAPIGAFVMGGLGEATAIYNALSQWDLNTNPPKDTTYKSQ